MVQDVDMLVITRDEDGCYNSSLFQSTLEYENYEKVTCEKLVKRLSVYFIRNDPYYGSDTYNISRD